MGSFGLYPKSKIYLGFGQGFDIFHSNQSSNPKSQSYSIKKKYQSKFIKKKVVNKNTKLIVTLIKKTKVFRPNWIRKKTTITNTKTREIQNYQKLSDIHKTIQKKNYSKFYGLLENPGKNSKLLKISELTENVGNKTISNYLKYSKVKEIPQIR